MEKSEYDPEVWDVAVGFAHQANQAWDELQNIKNINGGLDAMGIPESALDYSQAEEKYKRFSNLVGLMIGPSKDEYKEYVNMRNDNSGGRPDVIIYYVDGIEQYIERS